MNKRALFSFFSLFASLLLPRMAYPQSSAAPENPVLVSAFVNSIGINTHLDARTTSYANAGLVLKSLQFTGIKFVRDDAFEGGTPFSAARFKPLADAGIKFDLDLGDGNNAQVPQVVAAADRLEQAAPGSVSAVEGYNEVDEPIWAVTYAGSTVNAAAGYYQPVVQAQKALYQLAHADPRLNGVAVFNFSLAYPKHTPAVGDVTPYADFENLHAYPDQGEPPSHRIPKMVKQTVDTHGLPIVITETGYPTIYPGAKAYRDMVDEQIQNVFLTDDLLDNFSNHIYRTYIYELLDRRADGDDTHIQAHFGIFRYDGTPKPAAITLSNLLSLLQAGNSVTSSSQLSRLDDSFQANGSGVDSVATLLFQKGPHLYDLVYWAEPKRWDAAHLRMLPQQNYGTVSITFPNQFQTAEIFDPAEGRQALATVSGQNSVTYAIADHPIIVQVQF